MLVVLQRQTKRRKQPPIKKQTLERQDMKGAEKEDKSG